MASYATERKIRILKERLGADWETKIAPKRIDRAYNELVGDQRKNLFCKLRPDCKTRLDEMVDERDMVMSEFVESLIDREWDRFVQEREALEKDLAKQFAN